MTYDRPDKGSGFAPSDHPEWEGQLFVFWPQSMENIVYTKQNGDPDPTDVVTADVAIVTLQDPQTGRPVFLKSARIGGKALTPMIKNKLGKTVIGKLVKLPKQQGKNAAYALEFPPETPAGEAEWQQWCTMVQQYEAQYPRVAYEQPTGQTASWQSSSTPAQTPAPAPAANQWQSAATSPNGSTPPGTPTAAPASQTWGSQAQAQQPPTSAPAAAPWPPGLREFLTERGYDTSQMNEATARQIAATL